MGSKAQDDKLHGSIVKRIGHSTWRICLPNTAAERIANTANDTNTTMRMMNALR